jgi:hypothetical protein
MELGRSLDILADGNHHKPKDMRWLGKQMDVVSTSALFGRLEANWFDRSSEIGLDKRDRVG